MDPEPILDAREPGRREHASVGRVWLLAFLASLTVHAAILLAVTLSPPRPRPEPRVVVPEAISVELVQEGVEPAASAALSNLPIGDLPPSAPAADAEARPAAPPPMTAADSRGPAEAEPTRVAAPAPPSDPPATPTPEVALPEDPPRIASGETLPDLTLSSPVLAQATTALPDSPAGSEPAPPLAALDSAGLPDAPAEPAVALRSAPDAGRSEEIPGAIAPVAAIDMAAQAPRSDDPDRAQAVPPAASATQAARLPPLPATDARPPEPLQLAVAPLAAAMGPSEPLTKEARLPETLAPSPPPAALRASDPRTVVAGLLRDLSCSRVTATFDAATGALALRGNVRSEPERRRLASRLTAVGGISRVDESDLRVVGEPYCHLLAFLDRPDFQRSTEQRQDLAAVGAANPPAFRRIAGGQPIELTLSAPDFDSYLYVNHFSADGRVTHLLPSDRPDNFLRADAVFRLGPGAERGRRSVVRPPYGYDVALVIASSEPLFTRPRPAVEEAAGYLKLLDQRIRLLRASGLKVRYEYAYYILATAEPAAASAGSRLVR